MIVLIMCDKSIYLWQFYPFGFLHNDTALPEPSVGEGSSPPITLSDGFHFYDEIVRTVYVSELLKLYHVCTVHLKL